MSSSRRRGARSESKEKLLAVRIPESLMRALEQELGRPGGLSTRTGEPSAHERSQSS